MSAQSNKPSAIEGIKIASDGLRGSIKESLQDAITGAIREDDQAVIKFHGMYMQDDRDRREERAEKKLERLYSYMIRLRLPGGFLAPEKWIAMNDVANDHSTGVIKITTRQTVQLHGILKSHVKPTISAFNAASLDSIATCGDINRNVTCASHPKQSALHAEVFDYADKISRLLMPKTKAYYEIWLDEEKIVDKKEEEDPLYLDKYLPRKFKIGIAIPPNNDSDVFTNDLGLIAIIENNKLTGFNVAVGGGLSTTHGNADTYARLATVIGFANTENVLKVVYEVVTTQRDFGNRSDRKLARLKYTVDKMGVDNFRAEVEKRCGFKLEAAKPYTFTTRSDCYGWHKGENELWYYTVYVENGRVTDDEKVALKTALLEVAKTGKCNFLFTATQNVIVADVKEEDKAAIQHVLEQFNIIAHTEGASLIRKNSIACVALPTCPLALAEAQRYMPTLLSKIEPLLAKYGLGNEEIVIRMTGCPNGCGRPYAAEIGFVGTAPGHYNLHIGGDNQGERLNTLYKESLDEAAILSTLEGLFAIFKNERNREERFGDFMKRRLNL
jgi:sulfite reductase (NADPH) hemoprotein beta-component